MSTTLQNHILNIIAPKGVIPDLVDQREGLQKLAAFFDSCALGAAPGKPGETRVSLMRGSTDAGSTQAFGTIQLVSCLALTGVKINGVAFTALATGTPNTDETHREFVISGTDAADATSLAAAINACTNAAIAGVVQACNLSTTIQCTTVLAGDFVTIDGTVLTGTTGAPDRTNVFSVDTSDTATATALAAAINAHPTLRHKFVATSSTDTVTLRQKSGTTGLGLAGSSATFTLGASAPAAVDTVLLVAKQGGSVGNNIRLELMGVQASTTATVVSAVVTNTLVVNGTTLTAIKQRATGTLTAASAVAGDTCVVNGVTFTAKAGASGVGFPVGFSIDTSDTATATDLAAQINAHPTVSLAVTATSAAGVVTVRAVAAGTAGNAIVMAGTAVRLAFVGGSGVLSGGIAVANNQFDVSPGATDTQVAADIVRCINASTTALVSSSVRAANLAGVVTVYSLFPGTIGNAVTLSSTGGTITVAAARLAGGTLASSEGTPASGTIAISGGSGNYTATINGVATGNVPWTTSDSITSGLLRDAINALAAPSLGNVSASGAAGTVTITASKGGIAGNQITLAGTGTGTTVSGARLTGGVVPTTMVLSGGFLTGGVGGDPATVQTFIG